MAKLYILCGYSFSGKSTVAKALINRYGFVRVALDAINNERGISKDITSKELQETYDIYHDRIVNNLKLGKTVITDTVAHERAARDGLRKIAQENNTEAIVLYINTPLEVVKERWMKNRTTQERVDVEDKEFNSVVNDFEIPGSDESPLIITPDMKIEEIYKLIE